MSGVQFSFGFEPPRRHDLFYFALRPDRPAAKAAAELARRSCLCHGLQGRPYDEGRLHVSLCPAMSRRGPRKGDITAALAAAGRVQAEAFEIGFDRLSAFRCAKRRAIVLLCGTDVAPVIRLRESLNQELVKAGLGWGRGRFVPHLTLLWDTRPVPETRLETPVCWRADDFVLVHSLVGRSRQIDLGKWPLSENPSGGE